MLNKTINLAGIFNSSSLITRQAARDLFSIIAKSEEKKITLDFNKIEFASRSFFDELNSEMTKIALFGKEVEFVNLSESIEKLYKMVIDASKSKSSISYSSVANAEVITI